MLTIGEFSRLSRVSARMLRYYDNLGLLRPEEVGENGYRYYKQEQLIDILRIERLKGYGFPLSEVRELLTLPEGELAQRLHHRRLELYGELKALRDTLRRLEADILQLEGKNMSSKYHVIMIEDPEQKVFSLRRTINVSEFHDLFMDLQREAEKRGMKQAGPIQSLYHGEEFNYDHMDVEAQMVVASDGPGVTVKPQCTCAAVRHRGPYKDIHEAYNTLCAWMAEHPEYKVCGPAIERYLNAPDDTDPADLETGVLFPVKKA